MLNSDAPKVHPQAFCVDYEAALTYKGHCEILPGAWMNNRLSKNIKKVKRVNKSTKKGLIKIEKSKE